MEPFSIDESWLDITGSMHLFGGDGKAIADRLRREVRAETGLTISVGVSFNKVFAKLGSDLKKPDATTVITRENFRDKVWPLPVTDLLFVGRASSQVLGQYGVRTIGDLAAFGREPLTELLGKMGGQLYDYAAGLEHSPVVPARALPPPKSIGNSITFRRNLVGPEDIRTGVALLSDSVAARLRKHAMRCATVQVTIRDPDFRNICRQKRLDIPICTSTELSRAAMELIRESWNMNAPIRLLAITGQNLVPEDQAAEQMDLFLAQTAPRRERREQLERAVDGIRGKFGKGAIVPAAVRTSTAPPTTPGPFLPAAESWNNLRPLPRTLWEGVSDLTVSFFAYLSRLSDPGLLTASVLTLAVILVNGWTDAPNAIATAVSTGALPFRRAVRLAAVCNLLGVVCMTCLNASVAETIYTIADFGPDTGDALTALCAALLAIVLWATAAWRFGIPTSESHALVAGVTGAAAALQGGLSNVQPAAWAKVLLGLLLSVGLGFLLGRRCAGLVRRLFPLGHSTDRLFRRLQVPGAAAMAFLHGAQDGQKFMGVFLLSAALAQGRRDTETFLIPLWLMVLCALCMAAGTSIGGRRIIDTVGRDMVPLGPRQGFSADLAGALCLLLCTLLGLPVSTTHAKTAAILGVGAAEDRTSVDRRVARSILITWLFTFPGCGLIGFCAARFLLWLR